jgi:hypothetical protein
MISHAPTSPARWADVANGLLAKALRVGEGPVVLVDTVGAHQGQQRVARCSLVLASQQGSM